MAFVLLVETKLICQPQTVSQYALVATARVGSEHGHTYLSPLGNSLIRLLMSQPAI